MTLGQWSTLISIGQYIMAFCFLAIGTELADAIHRPAACTFSLIVIGLISVVAPAAQNYTFLLIRQIVTAAIGSPLLPSCLSIVGTHLPKQMQSMMMGLLYGAFSMAGGLSILLGGLLDTHWIDGVAASGALCLLLGLSFAFIVPEEPRADMWTTVRQVVPSTFAKYLVLIRGLHAIPSLALGIAANVLVGVQFACSNFVTMWLISEKGETPSTASTVTGALVLITSLPAFSGVPLLASFLKERLNVGECVPSPTSQLFTSTHQCTNPLAPAHSPDCPRAHPPTHQPKASKISQPINPHNELARLATTVSLLRTRMYTSAAVQSFILVFTLVGLFVPFSSDIGIHWVPIMWVPHAAWGPRPRKGF